MSTIKVLLTVLICLPIIAGEQTKYKKRKPAWYAYSLDTKKSAAALRTIQKASQNPSDAAKKICRREARSQIKSPCTITINNPIFQYTNTYENTFESKESSEQNEYIPSSLPSSQEYFAQEHNKCSIPFLLTPEDEHTLPLQSESYAKNEAHEDVVRILQEFAHISSLSEKTKNNNTLPS